MVGRKKKKEKEEINNQGRDRSLGDDKRKTKNREKQTEGGRERK